MKALIVGMGSMGKRRARLLKKLGVYVIGVDSNTERLQEAAAGVDAVYGSIQAALAEKPDLGIVCASPLAHYSIAAELLNSGLHVFTELNLCSQGYQELTELAEQKGLVIFPSSTWLYRKEMQYVIQAAEKANRKCAYTYHIGQYLPDWHPWESYKSYFIGDARTNGCREIMALELPWLIRAFGEIASVNVNCSNLTDLDIQYADTYQIQIKHSSGAMGLLMVDITAPVAIRALEVVGEKMQIFWQGRPETLSAYNPQTGRQETVDTYATVEHQDGYAANIIEDAYLDELKTFIAQVNGECSAIYTLSDDEKILRWIDRIEGK